MGDYTIFWMFKNPRRGRQARKFKINVLKILDLKSCSEQIQKLSLGAPLSFLSLSSNKILKDSTPGKVACIWYIERIQIDVIKFEKMENHFFVTFSLPSSSRCLRCLKRRVDFAKASKFMIGPFRSYIIWWALKRLSLQKCMHLVVDFCVFTSRVM